jgi:hypothetical protein
MLTAVVVDGGGCGGDDGFSGDSEPHPLRREGSCKRAIASAVVLARSLIP